MKGLSSLAMVLTVVGAVNLGLVGLGGFAGSDLDVLAMLFGSWPVVANIVYLLIGVSAVMVGYSHTTKQCHM